MSDIPNEGAIMWAELFKQRDELTRAQQALAQQVERLCGAAGVPAVVPHSLRGLYAPRRHFPLALWTD